MPCGGGTLYNFRFEADQAPPAPLTVTLDLFRPGTATSAQTSFNPGGFVLAFDGSEQIAPVNAAFMEPLVVQVLAPGGVPTAGALVGFAVAERECDAVRRRWRSPMPTGWLKST